jgi:hypothetical protein
MNTKTEMMMGYYSAMLIDGAITIRYEGFGLARLIAKKTKGSWFKKKEQAGPDLIILKPAEFYERLSDLTENEQLITSFDDKTRVIFNQIVDELGVDDASQDDEFKLINQIPVLDHTQIARDYCNANNHR